MQKQKEIKHYYITPELNKLERFLLRIGLIPFRKITIETIQERVEYKGGKDKVFVNKDQHGDKRHFKVVEKTIQAWNGKS